MNVNMNHIPLLIKERLLAVIKKTVAQRQPPSIILEKSALSAAFEKIKDACVAILLSDDRLCSGFIIDAEKGYVVSAAHCIQKGIPDVLEGYFAKDGLSFPFKLTPRVDLTYYKNNVTFKKDDISNLAVLGFETETDGKVYTEQAMQTRFRILNETSSKEDLISIDTEPEKYDPVGVNTLNFTWRFDRRTNRIMIERPEGYQLFVANRPPSSIVVVAYNVNNSGLSYKYNAKLVGVDPTGDLCVLQLQYEESDTSSVDPPPRIKSRVGSEAKFADSRTKSRGDIVFLYGSPKGISEQSISQGIIRDPISSAPGTIFDVEKISIDTSSTEGNSGGMIFDESGAVVGILSVGASGNLNYGVASFYAKKVVNDMIEAHEAKIPEKSTHLTDARSSNSTHLTDARTSYSTHLTDTKVYRKGYLGVEFLPPLLSDLGDTEKYDSSYTAPIQGLVVMSIAEDSPLATVPEIKRQTSNPNLKKRGTIITHIDGQRVGVNSLSGEVNPFTVVWFKKPGDSVTISYLSLNASSGNAEKEKKSKPVWETKMVTVTLKEYPQDLLIPSGSDF